jgi:hypothetical protein
MKTQRQRQSLSLLPPRTYVYHSKNGPGQYVFIFRQQPDGLWRGYLVVPSDAPVLSGGSKESRTKAWERTPRNIAFTEPVDSFESARRLAAFWADAAEKHLQQGRRFRRRIGYWGEAPSMTKPAAGSKHLKLRLPLNNQQQQQGSPPVARGGNLPGSSPLPL